MDDIPKQRYQVYKKRLEAILKQKNPKKVDAADAMLTRYKGREHAVYLKVCGKYGINPKPEWTPSVRASFPASKAKPNLAQNSNSKTKATRKPSQTPRSTTAQPSSIRRQTVNPIQTKLSALKKKQKSDNQAPNTIAKNIAPKKITSKQTVVSKHEESEEEYEEDFEDYSDDFDEDSDSKSTTSPKKERKRVTKSSTTSTAHPLIEKYGIKASATRTVFDLKERTIHEKYLKRVGTEIFSRGVQSLAWSAKQTQTQKPIKMHHQTQYEFHYGSSCSSSIVANHDEQKLESFVDRSGNLMEALLTFQQTRKTDEKDECDLDNGVTFEYSALLQFRSVNDFAFSQHNKNIIAVAYSQSYAHDDNKDDEKVDNVTRNTHMRGGIRNNGLICVWDFRRPSCPMYTLVADDAIQKIMFLPTTDTVIVGGRRNGCIAAWDLSEPSSLHAECVIEKETFYLRYPTYMTDPLWNRNHLYSIIAIASLNDTAFLSLDTCGNMHVWNITLQSQTPALSIDATKTVADLGCNELASMSIQPQFKCDLVRTSNLIVPSEPFLLFGNCVCVHPNDETSILFAFQSFICLLERIGRNVEMVRQFTLKYDVMGIAHDQNHVICVAFCAWKEHLFAAGYEDGMICLFNIAGADSNPIRRFYDPTQARAVTSVSWIKSDKSSVLLHALFKDGSVRVLDLNLRHVVEKRNLSKHNRFNAQTNSCCNTSHDFVAHSNTGGKHTFNVHQITTKNTTI